MKDRTLMFLGMLFIGLLVVGLVGYQMLFTGKEELSMEELASRCGPGTEFDFNKGKCVAVKKEGEVPSTSGDCEIEDLTLKFRGLLHRSDGDALKYVNTSYYVWQFDDEQGSKTLSVADWGTTGSYHEDITTLTTNEPLLLWYGDDDDTSPDHWIMSSEKEVGCQAAASVTVDVYNESHYTQGTGFSIEYYDGGTYEATANESVNAGETVSDSYFKIKESSGDASLGHPTIENPIGYCFGYNNTEVDEARIVDGSEFSVPSGLGGTADECWEWEHSNLFDYSTAEVDILLTFKTTMTDDEPGETIDMYLVTKNYYRDQNGNWLIGWEDADSNLVGMGDSTADLQIAYY